MNKIIGFVHNNNVVSLTIALASVILIMIYYLFKQIINKRKQTEEILKQQREKERLIHQITHHIRETLNLEEVLIKTVAEVKQFLNCDRVLIYRIWDDGTGTAITETVTPEYPIILGQTFPEEVFPQEYHQAYSQGKTRTINNIDQEDVEECLKEFIKQFGVKAKLVVPILQNEYLWGLLIAHQCNNTREWQHWEVDLMKQLALQVAIAIQQSELYEQLQQLNAELELRVQQRTEELAVTNEALRHTNYTLKALISASPRAIFTLDLAGKVKLWNPTAERVFGWKETEVMKQILPIISPEQTPEYDRLKTTVLLGLHYPSIELNCYTKDGILIDISLSAATLRDSHGNIIGLVAVVADITEQKKQEEQLRLLQSVVVNTNDCVMITEIEPINEPGPRIVYVNEAFTRITGYTLAEVIGKTPRFLQGEKTDKEQLKKVRNALENWQSVTVEVINYRKDGTEYWNEFSIVPVADKNGKYTHWVSVERDITERRKAEAELRKSEEMRLALEKEKELTILKTRFFSMASHEFRTPLSTMLAATQILESCEDGLSIESEKKIRNLRRIKTSVKNMIQLLDDILTINRAETGNLEFNPKLIELEIFCFNLIEELRLSIGNQHHIIFTSESVFEQVFLDEKLIRSILTNLLSNGIKYSPSRSNVYVSLICNEDEILWEIKDEGMGISSEDQKRLFEPFCRGENVGNIPGTGLGLVVVKKCVNLHGGSINFQSELGIGTTFKVMIPVRRN